MENSNELACAPHRAVVGSENEWWSTCTYVCFVYTALELSRVSSRAHSKVATLRTCEVEQTTEAKARMENGRDIRSGKLRSWTPVFNRMWSPTVGEQLHTVQEGS